MRRRSALYYVAGAVCWALWHRRFAGVASQEPAFPRNARRLSSAVAVAAAAWILFTPATLLASRGDGRLHVTFLDVGQGDAMFIVFPRGQTMVVDAGGLTASASFDIGDRVVAPVIRRAGFRRLDYLVLTHGDPDHIGGAASLLEEFRPREVWEGIPVPRFEPLTRLRVAAQAQGARWANVYANSRIVIDGVEVVCPPSKDRRLGAAEGPQRRLDGPRAPLARCVGAADRRHRQGSGARDRARHSGVRGCAS